MKARLLLITAALVGALALGASGSARPLTTAPPPVVDIRVTITDNAISMSPKRASRGDYARFILVNNGRSSHTFTFGSSKRHTGAQTGFSKPLRPKEQKILLLFLDYRGKVPYFGSLPADRSKPAMKGVFIIS